MSTPTPPFRGERGAYTRTYRYISIAHPSPLKGEGWAYTHTYKIYIRIYIQDTIQGILNIYALDLSFLKQKEREIRYINTRTRMYTPTPPLLGGRGGLTYTL